MSKQKKEQEQNYEDTIKSLNKKYSNPSTDYFDLSTGSLKLDIALGGKGIRSGRITELIAWEGSGKTTLCLHLIAEAQKRGLKVAYIDSEHALDKKYAKAIGVDWEELLPTLFQPMTGDEAFDVGIELLKTDKVKLIIFDSTSGMIPESQFTSDAGSSHMGKHAQLFSKEVPKINALAAKHNAIVVFVSQLREKIGVMMGNPEITQAGNALKFFASNRIKLTKALIKEGDSVTGISVGFHLVKCKTSNPFTKGRFPLSLGKGIDRTHELIEVAADLNVIKQAGSWFSYGEIKLGQGANKVHELLESNTELMSEIQDKVYALIDSKGVNEVIETVLEKEEESE